MEFTLGFGIPANKVVYYNPGRNILSAVDLQEEPDFINEIIPVEGKLTTDFGVNPLFVATDRGTYHLLYAPLGPLGTSKVYDSEGNEPHFGKILSSLEIVIPDKSWRPIRLSPANIDSFNKFVESQEEKETNSNNSVTMHEMGNFGSRNGNYDDTSILQEIEKIKSRLENQSQKTPVVDPEISNLRRDVAQLYDILDALIRRVYSLYPINRQMPMRINNYELTEIPLDEYERMKRRGEISEDRIDPLLQPYISSHRSNNRIKTVISKSGKGYFVQCNIDPTTKNISLPQFKE
ncbi:MAG: hypothetical protein Solivirus2_51 [Solivirus sp.]|uniref:Uncharacterized protein n=1 Tax=Solivirus sp. TaxID=2487772 RepID=A0A3G5AFL5_9VIRU|nr:MAG: hypothetical protein Solivirus2_51 [Solivirus sp.]